MWGGNKHGRRMALLGIFAFIFITRKELSDSRTSLPNRFETPYFEGRHTCGGKPRGHR